MSGVLEPARASTVVLSMKSLLAVPLMAMLGGCMTAPPPPAAPYRALGTEPFWNVLIDQHDVTFIEPDQAQPLRDPRPQPTVSAAGQTYRTPRMTVTITRGTCSDGMSDRVYPDIVRVTVGGRQLSGCGGL
jgi:uncharacterized membrane protein